LAPPAWPAPPPKPDHVSGRGIHQQIGKLLSEHAALTQQKIDLLRRRLEMDGTMSDMQREALLKEIKALQEERLGVLAAAEALKSEALQGLLQNLVSTEDILKTVQAELKRHKIQVDLKDLNVHLNEQQARPHDRTP